MTKAFHWKIAKDKRTAFLLDIHERIFGGVVAYRNFRLGFVNSADGGLTIGGNPQRMALLGAYPSLVSAGKAVEYEAGYRLRNGHYKNIVNH